MLPNEVNVGRVVVLYSANWIICDLAMSTCSLRCKMGGANFG